MRVWSRATAHFVMLNSIGGPWILVPTSFLLSPPHHPRPPQPVPAAAVAQVELVPDLARPARPGNDQGDAVQGRLQELIVRQLRDAFAEKSFHDLLRLRSLDLQGGEIGRAH